MKIKYYRVRRNEMAFWEPTKTMRALGFSNQPLGKDGPNAWAKAHGLNAEHQQARRIAKLHGAQAVINTQCPHLKGTLNALYWHYKCSAPFKRLRGTTREDYPRAWKHIGSTLGRKLISSITEVECQQFQVVMEQNHSEHERFLTIKILRKFMGIAAERKWIGYNPAKSLPNPMPSGRSEYWLNTEIFKLIDTATDLGYDGMSVGLRIMWDTLFSPVDVRTLWVNQIRGDSVWQKRAKTGKGGVWTLSSKTINAVQSYVQSLPFDILAEQPIIRMRSGQIYRNKDTFAKDFRAVRNIAFPGDKRQMLDFRRSGNLEAAIGDATPKERADMLANTLDKSRFLEATYTPPNRAKSDNIRGKREAGRDVLSKQQKCENIPLDIAR